MPQWVGAFVPDERRSWRQEWQPPHLLTNPADDAEFRRDVFASIGPFMHPASLEAALRDRYPNVAVHVRHLSGETWAAWYVYRDGHWVGRPGGQGEVDDRETSAGRG